MLLLLARAARDALKISVLTNSDVRSLMTNDDGHVTGVRYQQGGEGEVIELPAASVVLTTGGKW